MAALTKRMVIRLPDDLDTWIGEQSAREGLDNATWARAVLTRLKNGLPPIAGSQPQRVVTARDEPYPQTGIDPYQPIDDLDALLESRVEQAVQASGPSPFVTSPQAADDLSHELVGTAHPLRRLERVKYNPGRGGYG
jgi:hypothetical protein